MQSVSIQQSGKFYHPFKVKDVTVKTKTTLHLPQACEANLFLDQLVDMIVDEGNVYLYNR